MSEMVERVARAIDETVNPGGSTLENYIPAARAAISAMRGPTQEMLIAMRETLRVIDGNAGGESGPCPELEEGTELNGYQAAIDAAMS